MIIECEKCQTRFNLDESLLKQGGTKVRCSFCKHIFVAYPSDQVPAEAGLEDQKINFDNLLEGPLDEVEELDGLFPGGLNDFERDETIDAEKSLDETLDREASTESIGITPASIKKRSNKSRFLAIILVIILALAGTATAIYFLIQGSKEVRKDDIGVRRLSLKAVTGSFVDSKKAGHLFVIRGIVINNYSKSRSFILIKGTILNEKGQIVRKKLAYAGNNFKIKNLKGLPLVEIKKAMKNRYGIGKKNVDIAPGASLPFTIVFENLPEDLSEFTVEAVSSSPGT